LVKGYCKLSKISNNKDNSNNSRWRKSGSPLGWLQLWCGSGKKCVSFFNN